MLLADQDNWTTLLVEKRDYRGYKVKVTTETLTRPTDEDIAERKRAYEAYSTLSARAHAATKGEAEALSDAEKATLEYERQVWLTLHKVEERWNREHRSKVYRLESETKQLHAEVERVEARIAKGRALRGED